MGRNAEACQCERPVEKGVNKHMRQENEMLSESELQKAMNKRYSPEIFKKLDQAKVAVAGLGGLGSNVVFFLVRSGVKQLHLIDFDRVDYSNLNRQQYFLQHVGMYKTEAIKKELESINPYLKITADCVKVTEDNIKDLFESEDIICEAFDVPEMKAMLVNGILEHFPDKKLVSASGMAGYGDSNEIRTRKVSRNFYLCGDGISAPECEGGLMAPRVAMCAAHEANMIIKLILKPEL